jgi:hypothetical protein
MREDALNTKRAVAILLALSVVFHGSQPWSDVTQEACAQSKSASAKRAPKPTRVFSTTLIYGEGVVQGTVVAPRGRGFGWDSIFQPQGSARYVA